MRNEFPSETFDTATAVEQCAAYVQVPEDFSDTVRAEIATIATTKISCDTPQIDPHSPLAHTLTHDHVFIKPKMVDVDDRTSKPKAWHHGPHNLKGTIQLGKAKRRKTIRSRE